MALGTPNLNGIAATPNGKTLIVSHSSLGALYTVDPHTGASALPVGRGQFQNQYHRSIQESPQIRGRLIGHFLLRNVSSIGVHD